jgi:hypothetical protein
MGSSRKPKSTRARAARSVKSVPKPRRKPATPKSSGVRTAADARRVAERFRATGSAEQFRVSPTQAIREMRDGVPTTALEEIHHKLEIAGAVAYICAATLRAQAADYDTDIALCLQRCVGDEIDRQMGQIDGLLGRERTFDDGERDGGAV